MATPNATETLQPSRTTKSGISLESFEDVKLFKLVPATAPVTSVQDALTRLGNDHAKLLAIIHSGLQAETVNAARQDDSGWLKIDENGKDTSETFEGSLVSSDILNPFVLAMSRVNPATVLRAGKEVEITWDECQSPEEKRAVKDATLEMIRTTPRIVANLKKKMEAASKAE